MIYSWDNRPRSTENKEGHFSLRLYFTVVTFSPDSSTMFTLVTHCVQRWQDAWLVSGAHEWVLGSCIESGRLLLWFGHSWGHLALCPAVDACHLIQLRAAGRKWLSPLRALKVGSSGLVAYNNIDRLQFVSRLSFWTCEIRSSFLLFVSSVTARHRKGSLSFHPCPSGNCQMKAG